MAHFNFVISQNAKWGHAGFYIDCHRMTVRYRKIFFYKKALQKTLFNSLSGKVFIISVTKRRSHRPYKYLIIDFTQLL